MSTIEWTDETWNPVIGCTKVSEGCRNCYAMGQARRMAGIADAAERKASGDAEAPPVSPRMRAYSAVVKRSHEGVPLPQWNNKVRCIDAALAEPFQWGKPRMVFVNSMSDLFHESVPFAFIDRVFATMALCPQHTFQILTKRPQRMAEWSESRFGLSVNALAEAVEAAPLRVQNAPMPPLQWPLPNVWLGTSAEDQQTADERIPHLLRCHAAVRFVSCEPLLGPVDLNEREYMCAAWVEGRTTIGTYLDWVIVGGESGPGSRLCHVEWIRSIVAQCGEAGTPVFVKQLGAHLLGQFEYTRNDWSACEIPLKHKKGGDMSEWPEDLRIREMPRVREEAGA